MKLAIIGASTGQLPICLKAREMGIETHCFAWEKGAVCREVVDHFYPISVFEKEQILEQCRQIGVDGVVTNASDTLAEVVAWLTERLGLVGNPYEVICRIREKSFVREATREVKGLKEVRNMRYRGTAPDFYPCIIKPVTGASKQGVSLVNSPSELASALHYAREVSDEMLIEEYIEGRELSVECLSAAGRHHVVQLTDKENSGPPHFVELGHHQPAQLDPKIEERIRCLMPELLTSVGIRNGATHTELRIDCDGEIRLIEINARGGGDHISSTLVELSTGYDYLRGMIEVALGLPVNPVITNPARAGIYFLAQQSASLLPLFREAEGKPWLVELSWQPELPLQEATGNYDRNGHLIYCSEERINP